MLREGIRGEFHDNRIHVDLADGGKLVARANICATGVEWRRLGLANESRFLGTGLYYGGGASEAQFCAGQHVLVVGGGNSAGQAPMHLSEQAQKVTMVVRNMVLTATLSHYLVNRILANPKIEIRYETSVTDLDGDEHLRRVQLTDNNKGSAEWIETEKLFVVSAACQIRSGRRIPPSSGTGRAISSPAPIFWARGSHRLAGP